MVRNIAGYVLAALVLLIAAIPLWYKSIPAQYVNLLAGLSPVVERAVCHFSTKVSGESMDPVISPGSSVTVNRCFDEKDLTEGAVILFHDGSRMRFGSIRHVLPLDPVVYKVSDEKAPELLHDVIKEEIGGRAEDIDTSGSKYQLKQNADSFILKADDYLSDFYLAKIPKGMGIEASTPQKTTVFSRNKDKFCMVVVPKKELAFVDIEIINTQTNEVATSSKGIVFGMKPSPNVNCQDFGTGQGMLNVNPGTYRYRFLMNHQVLADVRFEVR